MKQEDFEKLENNMKEKLGKDNFAKISDDIATLMSENNNMNTQLSARDTEITQLKQDKSNLIETNGNLMQKISVGFEEPMKNPNTEETKPKTKLSDAFDEKGRFI